MLAFVVFAQGLLEYNTDEHAIHELFQQLVTHVYHLPNVYCLYLASTIATNNYHGWYLLGTRLYLRITGK